MLRLFLVGGHLGRVEVILARYVRALRQHWGLPNGIFQRCLGWGTGLRGSLGVQAAFLAPERLLFNVGVGRC